MRHLQLLLILFLLFCHTPALGLPAGRQAGQSAKRLTLPNGLRVIVNPNCSTEVVAIDLLLDVSAFDEPADRNGIRCLVQRLLLRGTRSESGDEMSRRLAAAGGMIDTTVGLDYLEIYSLVPADGFEVALALLADAVQHPAFSPEEITKQKLAAQKLAQTATENPFQETYLAFRRALYRDHPYGRPTFGDWRLLAEVTRDDLLNFYAQHYRPNRAVLAICGCVGQAQAMKAVRQRFGDWIPGEPSPPRRKPVAPLTCSEVVARELPISRAHLILGFGAPAADEPGYFAIQVLDSLLSGGASARLPRILREELGLVYDTSSFYPTLTASSHLALHAVTQPHLLDTVKAAMIEILTTLTQEAVAPEELTRAKRYLLGSYALSHQRMKDQAYALAWYEILGLGTDFEERYADSIQAVTPFEVQQAAQVVLHRFVLAVTMPTT